jgi:isopenicillin N synthase-like dioxygenase
LTARLRILVLMVSGLVSILTRTTNNDSRTGVFNSYPPTTAKEREDNAIGLGSHADLQLFTLLWQNHVGGLQVLNKDGQWIKVKQARSIDTAYVNFYRRPLSKEQS